MKSLAGTTNYSLHRIGAGSDRSNSKIISYLGQGKLVLYPAELQVKGHVQSRNVTKYIYFVTLLKNVQSVRLFLLLAFQTNFTKKQTYEVSPVTC